MPLLRRKAPTKHIAFWLVAVRAIRERGFPEKLRSSGLLLAGFRFLTESSLVPTREAFFFLDRVAKCAKLNSPGLSAQKEAR